MAVVALIPTGRMEHLALPEALSQLFRGHTFVVRPPETHLNGFTTEDVATLVANPSGPVLSLLEELVATLVNAIQPGRKQLKIHYAFVVEDLELKNDHQPDRVVQVFREAVERYISLTWPGSSAAPVFAAVRERCSFHLFRPMPEAYFFGEPAALQRAGVLATQSVKLPPGLDLEQFRTTDPDYLALAENQLLADLPERERHPKSYLQYLCDPLLTGGSKRRYRETGDPRGGVAALKTLDWKRVLSDPPHCPFLHAFLDDLSYALEQPLAFVDAQHANPRTQFPGEKNRLLRNL